MKAVQFTWSAVFLFFANLCEILFTLTLAFNYSFILPGIIWHLIGAVLLFFGVKGKVKKQQKSDLGYASIKDEHLIPKKSVPGYPDLAGETQAAVDDDEHEDIWTKLSLPVGLFVPVMGVLGLTILVLIVKTEASDEYQAFEEYREFIRFNQLHKPRFEKIDVMMHAAGKLDVEPVVDLLSGKDKNMVWGSIDVLSKMADEKAVGLIRKTMSRTDSDVKFYSAWGLDRIENRFILRRKEFEDQFRTKNDLGALMALLELMHSYIETRLPEGPLMTKFSREALEWTLQGRQKFPENLDLRSNEAFFLFHAGETAKAGEIFMDLFRQGKLSPKFIPDCAELFFRRGDFATVKLLVESFTRNPDNDQFLLGRTIESTLDDLRHFWIDDAEKAS